MSFVKTLLEEYKTKKVNLQTVTEDVIKADVIRQVVYRRADFISTGLKVVGLQNFTNLDVKFQFPSYMTMSYPVAEGARAEHGKINWTDFTMSMGKAEGSFMITDEAQVRGLDRIQYTTGVRRLSEALAVSKDENILASLTAGKSADIDCSNALYDTPEEAIPYAIGQVILAKGVTDADINKIAVILPVAHWAKTLKLKTIENIVVAVRDYLRQTYGIAIYPTKYTGWTNEGLCLITGADTAVHGVLTPPAGIPMVETKRYEAVGVEYVIRQFFATKVVPDSSTVTTSSRIVRFTGLNTWT